MGITINEEFVDDRGIKTVGCYGSFSNEIRVRKVNCMEKKEITAEDASGNDAAFKESHYTTDESGNQVSSSKHYVLVDNQKYSVWGDFVVYASKDIRKETENRNYPELNNVNREDRDKIYSRNSRRPMFSLRISETIDVTDLPNVFTKLYENLKADKNRFPYTDITDDL